MSFPNDFYAHLKNHNYTEIKGGIERKNFLEIWVVAVDNRIFARSWNKSAKSWFTAFIETGVGQLKYGEKIINVEGEKLDKTNKIQQSINEAYLSRYNQKENIYYSEGITKPEYLDYTMEFFFSKNDN
ncbi:DUF2255 family protein [Marixanthomonas ophiurae]|uniref:DUF2255 family protein n=1 Tax=Marixanthomonas ophiurae TaxID=387659 RepID=A0A3E1QBJ1_9FLAO|nr:DUF2255 family protein [Marixanthomonas ophiurae]RFN59488.1 DUF2255 family protein [Marixanthomonas ophiurae]